MSHVVKAGRGSELRCKGWRQEGILRTLESALECGTKPEELITYDGNAKVARNWDCYNKIVKALMELEEDETLIVQSGKPVLISKTHKQMARVIHASCLLLPKWDNPETLHQLEEKGLTMFGSIAGASWEWNLRGMLAPTYEVLKSLAKQHFGGTLRGKVFLSAGLGGSSQIQPLACKAIKGVCIIVEADEKRIQQAKENGAVDVSTNNLDEALKLAKEAMEEKEPLAIALLGNTGDVYPEMVEKGVTPDIVTDMTPYDNPPYGIIPAGLSPEEAEFMSKEKPDELMRRITENAVQVAKAMLQFKDKGAVVFDYGTGVCELAISAGLEEASKIDAYGVVYTRQNTLKGRDFFNFTALSGDTADIDEMDEVFLRELAGDEVVVDWVALTREIPQPPRGLPLRVVYLHHGQRKIALTINEMVRNGILRAPIVLHGGEWNVGDASPETNADMKDGSDVIADWCHLTGLLSAALGADSVTLVGMASGSSRTTRWFTVLDGTIETDERLERLLRVDAELVITRWADAGYEEPRSLAKEMSVKMPSLQ